MLTLVTIDYSPWSEKARWALDYHAIPYTERSYAPVLDEFALRKELGNWTGRITIPVLICQDRAIFDSYAIAKFAEQHSVHKAPLIDPNAIQTIEYWNQKSELALQSIRAIVTRKVLASTDACRELVPSSLRKSAWMSRPATRLGASYLRRKYGYSARDMIKHRRQVGDVLCEARRSLANNGFVGKSFGFADIAVAAILQGVDPVTDEYIKIGPATRACYRDDEWNDEFSDLVQWRDDLYDKYRGTASKR